MQQFSLIRSIAQQPLFAVIAVLAGAGVAKSGHGIWAAAGILAALPVYVGAAVTFMANRSLEAKVACMRCREASKP
jgi:hypothetical protein